MRTPVYNSHSTMYLLKLINTDFREWIKLFTFHHVSIKTHCVAEITSYITGFTFHHVSIKTKRYIVMKGSAGSFTFHHVSIKTLLASRIPTS